MKSLKIFSLMMLMLVAITGCEKDKPVGGGDDSAVVGQWVLTSWNEEAPEFNVYISFENDGTFAIYQQVWSLDYECFEGTYQLNGDILTGQYADNSIWASGYKVETTDNTLVLYSQDDQSVKSVYEKCEIPAEIIEEATTTRAAEAVPFL